MDTLINLSFLPLVRATAVSQFGTFAKITFPSTEAKATQLMVTIASPQSSRCLTRSNAVWEVMFHPNHPNYLFSCSSDGRVLLWDFQASRDNSKPIFSVDKDSMKVYELIRQETASPVNSIDFEPNSKSIVCVADNEYLAIRTNIEVF
jgi:WD40 repeat protein